MVRRRFIALCIFLHCAVSAQETIKKTSRTGKIEKTLEDNKVLSLLAAAGTVISFFIVYVVHRYQSIAKAHVPLPPPTGEPEQALSAVMEEHARLLRAVLEKRVRERQHHVDEGGSGQQSLNDLRAGNAVIQERLDELSEQVTSLEGHIEKLEEFIRNSSREKFPDFVKPDFVDVYAKGSVQRLKQNPSIRNAQVK